jgi:hypothetical protein
MTARGRAGQGDGASVSTHSAVQATLDITRMPPYSPLKSSDIILSSEYVRMSENLRRQMRRKHSAAACSGHKQLQSPRDTQQLRGHGSRVRSRKRRHSDTETHAYMQTDTQRDVDRDESRETATASHALHIHYSRCPGSV